MRLRSLASVTAFALIGCNARFNFDVPAGPTEAGVANCAEQCKVVWGQSCAPEWNVCVECNQDSDCTADPNRPRCSADRRCVQCKTNNDCPAGNLCVATNYECRPACNIGASDDVCASIENDWCGVLGVCAECDRDIECVNSGHGNRCLDCGYCVQCRLDADCHGVTPKCDPVIHQCVECSDGRNCPSGCCDQSTHQCY